MLGTVSKEEDLERGLGQGKEVKHIAEGSRAPRSEWGWCPVGLYTSILRIYADGREEPQK